jgi:hypothetical protein
VAPGISGAFFWFWKKQIQKPVVGPEDETVKGFRITSSLPTTRSEPVNERFDRWQLLRIGLRITNPILNE